MKPLRKGGVRRTHSHSLCAMHSRAPAIATSAFPPVDSDFSGSPLYALSAPATSPVEPRNCAFFIIAAPTSTGPSRSVAPVIAASSTANVASFSACRRVLSDTSVGQPKTGHSRS